ncbi:MAG TPA: glycerol-3-phosphate 1-O-acyltransferase PlsY [Vicinamibacterales bacterium]|jgi:glycerol-3-phosphate acyltransferase PlsY|nr:glycerol-3-phosphate 1-O-acyltransferase PlsY [Vicinamibacterales bacterium]
MILLLAYFLGSIPFALLVARRLGGVDPRVSGSGNVGAANVLRTTNKRIGVFVLLLDVGKGAAAVGVARAAGASDVAVAGAALAAVVGHIYPIWLKLRGGKGVAVACGAFAVLTPLATALAVAIFGVVVWATRYVSLGSVVATAALPPLADAAGAPPFVVLAAAASAALIIFRHRGNLLRLVRRTERRIGEPV